MPRFEPVPCPKLQGGEWLAGANCGYLVVPEDRGRPTGRTIRLMVVKHPAQSQEKRPDPVIYLAGGPGDIAPLEVNGLITADFIRDRDIPHGQTLGDPAARRRRSTRRAAFTALNARRAFGRAAAIERCQVTPQHVAAVVSVAAGNSISRTKPWLAFGMSRASWYRAGKPIA